MIRDMRAAAFIRQNAIFNAAISEATFEPGFEPQNVYARSADRVWRTVETDPVIEFALDAPSVLEGMLIRLPAERDPDIPAGSPLAPDDEITVTAWADRMDPPIFEATFEAGHDERFGYVPFLFTSGGVVTPITASHLRLEFTHTGQMDVDAIWAGEFFQPEFQYNRGGQFGFDEQAETDRSGFAGRRFSETRARLLRWALTWDAWNEAELSRWEDFAVDKGIVRPFVAFRTLTAPLARRVMIATFAQAAQVTDRDGAHFLIRADLTEDF